MCLLFISEIDNFTRKTVNFTRKTVNFTRKTVNFTRKTVNFTRKTVNFTRKRANFTRKTVNFTRNLAFYRHHWISSHLIAAPMSVCYNNSICSTLVMQTHRVFRLIIKSYIHELQMNIICWCQNTIYQNTDTLLFMYYNKQL